jgi:hypothetical protein
MVLSVAGLAYIFSRLNNTTVSRLLDKTERLDIDAEY